MQRRALLIAIVLPLAITASNQLVLSWFAKANSSSMFEVAACYALFVLQIAFVSVVAGRFMSGWLRWTVFAWTLAVLDLMAFMVALATTAHAFVSNEVLAFALISGQLGAVVVWGVLGAERWLVRVPTALATVLVILLLWNNAIGGAMLVGPRMYLTTWFSLVLVQLAQLGLASVLLRLNGYRIMQLDLHSRSQSTVPQSVWQFNLRDILLQTSLVAVMLVVARATISQLKDYWNMFAYNDPYSWDSVAVEFVMSLILATVMASSLWIVLGQQFSWKRFALFVTFVVSTGTAIGGMFKLLEFGQDPWSSDPNWWWLVEPTWWWLPWVSLSAGFLVATLWIFREIGYRLVRTSERPARASESAHRALAEPR